IAARRFFLFHVWSFPFSLQSMDPTTFLKNEILRPIGTQFLPAGLAVSPYLALALGRFGEMWQWVEAHTWLSLGIFLAVLYAVGMILENIGSRFECWIYKCIKEPKSEKAW